MSSVKIKLSTFPFQKYRMMDGTIKRISADASNTKPNQDHDESSGKGVGVSPYKAIVHLKQQRLSNREFHWPLVPERQVVAEMREGERTVMEYLLSPVKKAASEAGMDR